LAKQIDELSSQSTFASIGVEAAARMCSRVPVMKAATAKAIINIFFKTEEGKALFLLSAINSGAISEKAQDVLGPLSDYPLLKEIASREYDFSEETVVKEVTGKCNCHMERELSTNYYFLPCEHSFCQKCLKQLESEKASKCPICQAKLPKSLSPTHLGKDFVRETIERNLAFRKMIQEAHVFCSKCEDEATHFCSDCSAVYCIDHSKLHSKEKSIKGISQSYYQHLKVTEILNSVSATNVQIMRNRFHSFVKLVAKPFVRNANFHM
jgi:hypothetical protein